MKITSHAWAAMIIAGFGISSVIWNPLPKANAAPWPTSAVPKFEVDPYWPKPLPDNWVTGRLGGVCVDAQDHVFVVNRQDLEEKETETGTSAPPVIEFDAEGNVVHTFGDPKVLPKELHTCFVDREQNLWIGGSEDGIVQKYTHDGSKLLLQIGTKGVLDSSDGTADGRALNSSHTGFFYPSGISIDPTDGDIYVSDGYGNSRVAVFDRYGKFLRQWGRQGTAAEAEAAVGGSFLKVVHCVKIDNSGLVYVCDKQGDRVQVFDKMGNFKRNFLITPRPHYPNARPTLWGANSDVAFSPDPEQKFMYAADEWRDQIDIFDRATGQMLSTFGRPGHQLGELSHPHTLAVDSKGNIYEAETGFGRRVQKFKIVLNSALAAAEQTVVTFCAPVGTHEAMEQIFSGFESKTGYKVKPTFGTGTDLKKQVANGEAFDLPVFQAPYLDVLNSGNVIESSAKALATEFFGIAVKKGAPKPDISSPEAVKKLLLSAKSISSGGGVVNARLDEALKQLGIGEQLEPKLKRLPSVAEAMRMAANGEVEFGITLLNEMEDPGIDIVGPLPKEIVAPIVLVGLVSTHAKNPQATEALLDYLSSPEVSDVYSKHRMKPGH